jgi:hypothetical protein
MNATTMFLSQLIGPFAIVGGLMILFNKPMVDKVLKSMDKEPLGVLIAGYASLVISLAILLKHNLWVSPAEIIISLIGWIGLVKGLLLMLATDKVLAFSKNMTDKLMIGGVVWLLIGGYLSYVAYFI